MEACWGVGESGAVDAGADSARATGAGVTMGAAATAVSTGLGFARLTGVRRGRAVVSGVASSGSSGCETFGGADSAGAGLGLRAGFAGAGSSAAGAGVGTGAGAVFLTAAFFAATFLGAGVGAGVGAGAGAGGVGGAGTSALALTAFLAGARLGLAAAAAGSGKVVWDSSLLRVLKRG